MKTTKIAAGLYELTYQGRTFQIEDQLQASDGEGQPGWMVYEMNAHGDREFCNDYMTKRAAIARTVDAVDAGY